MTLVRTKKMIVAVGAMAALMAAPAVDAHTFTGSTSTTIGYARGAFRGRISSNVASCKIGRTVRLYKVKKGPDRLLGKTKSNRRGKWSIARAKRRGRYYAKVAGRQAGTYGHNHRCAAATSATLRIG